VSGTWSTNQISNGTFDSNLTGWTESGSSAFASASAGSDGNLSARTGGGSAFNSTLEGEIYQVVSISSSVNWVVAHVWAGLDYGGDEAILTLELLDASDNVLASCSEKVPSSATAGAWQPLTCVLPEVFGATQAKIRLIADNIGGTNASVGFDDAALYFQT